jgi:hypothetical protein
VHKLFVLFSQIHFYWNKNPSLHHQLGLMNGSERTKFYSVLKQLNMKRIWMNLK